MADVARPRQSLLLAAWLTGCILATVGAVGAYLVAQQVGRRAADDVPQALVNERVAALSQPAVRSRIPDEAPSPLTSQSVPFVIVYDSAHRVLSSTALLDDATPGLPAGTLDAAAQGRTAVTWQPRAGVREAVVAEPWAGPDGSGVVVAGVGLGTTEERAQSALLMVITGWALVVLVLTGIMLGVTPHPRAPGGTRRRGQ